MTTTHDVSGAACSAAASDNAPGGVKNIKDQTSVHESKRSNDKKRRPNFNQVHNKALPLTVHPLPTFHPTNPISLLRLAYAYVIQLLSQPSSHSQQAYVGYFSAQTRSIHVTEPEHVRALWEMGFFGKGTLSRSEPSWLDREVARLQATRKGGGTAEEATNARREARREFKLERARAEREKIDRQRMVERGELEPEPSRDTVDLDPMMVSPGSSATSRAHANGAATKEYIGCDPVEKVTEPELQERVPDAQPILGTGLALTKSPDIDTLDLERASEDETHLDIVNQEHLQLTMEEAFFLSYALGVLDVRGLPSLAATTNDGQHMPQRTRSAAALLSHFAGYSVFPPRSRTQAPPPDDQFLLNYVTYHHFRSLGWVVRSGVKFGVDYLLYQRGPVFSHAEFAIIIVPSYSHHYWSTQSGKLAKRVKEDKDWWWLHCVNRVQGAVLKTLILVYVDIPPPSQHSEHDIGELLRGYKIREFAIKRWVMNRSRD